MPDTPDVIAQIDSRIAAVRENLRDLLEQAAAYSGAADDDLVSQRIAEQEALLDKLTRTRDLLVERR
jgi:ABC-type transporter Mla subunit MlaD